MEYKTVLVSSLPAILFFSGIVFLSYSSLTMSKVVTVQNEVFVILFQELGKTDLPSALVKTFEHFFTDVLWIILIFLVLISCGLLVYLLCFQDLDLRVFVVSQILMIFLILIITNLSITMLLTAVSLFAGIGWMHKNFEPDKRAFTTGYSVVASKIGFMSIFMVIGILMTLFANSKNYEEEMQKTNMELIKNFMPDMTEAKEAQKDQVEQLTEGFKFALSERYDYLPENTKTECKVLYEGLTESLDSYKQQTFQKIDEQEMTVSEEQVMQIFPLFGLIIKATPLIIAISAYALLSVLTPVMGIFGGIVYSAFNRNK